MAMLKRGTCPYCGGEECITPKGRWRAHDGGFGHHCEGSGKMAEVYRPGKSVDPDLKVSPGTA